MNAALSQWFTPRWVAEAIVERHLVGISAADTVLEPSCGRGAFLLALPPDVGAIGVEIDPLLARQAAAASGRTVITGDFLEVGIPVPITHIIGNPPFDSKTVHGFLARAHALLPDEGTCGFLLPAYLLQTSSRVMGLAERWSIAQELMPRDIFPRLKLPLVFARFRKDRRRTLVGFFLYSETLDVRGLPRTIRKELTGGSEAGSVWRRAVRRAFEAFGALAPVSLEELYAAVERPRPNPFWREKVRQVLQTYPEFRSAGRGVWELAA